MRRVEFDARAAGRFQSELQAARPRSWSAYAHALCWALGFLVILAHAAERSGCFEVGGARIRGLSSVQLEPKMRLASGLVGFAVASALVSASSFGQQCDELVVWGNNTNGGLNNIPNAAMVAVSSNYHLSVGIDAFGQIHTWGAPDIRSSVPSRKGLTQVEAGNNWCLARDVGGTIVAWGDNSKGQCVVPEGVYVDMACGDWHNVAILSDGTLRCWGDNSKGACNAPSGTYTSVGAGSWHSLGITSSGSVVGWGYDFGQLQAPEGVVFTQVVGGWKHSIGLALDGSIRGWGLDIGGALTQIPQSGTYLSIDCSASRGIALRSDGRVVTWGTPSSSEWPVPDGRFVAVSAGYTVEVGVRCACRCDLVVDSIVNAADMAIVLNFWGTNGSQFPGVDINADGIVDGADLAAVLNAWGPCPQ